MNQDLIRNFAIVAHIDHGKSTLADRLLEMTGTVAKRDMQAQVLDSNPIERERGITIKLAPVRMEHKEYILNLIDTPGHVDFGYEVSRSLAACEGALLVVDATQGVQAQTLANLVAAREHKLAIIPLINKIDLPNARVEETTVELRALGFKDEEILQISAKTGKNVEQVLEAIIERVPPPAGGASASLRALIFSSQYDSHKGVVVFVRIVDGSIGSLQGSLQGPTLQLKLRFMVSGAEVTPIEIGYFSPKMIASDSLRTGEVGYIATGLKDIRVAKVGDTITLARMPNDKFQMTNEKQKSTHDSGNQHIKVDPLPGYKEPKPMVFVGLFPLASNEFTNAREAMERLRLSDSAFSFRPIASAALGHGFHCGFLGLLHAEIVQERLVREFGITMIATAPSVEYQLLLKGAAAFTSIQSASEFPDPSLIDQVREPVMNVAIYSPKRYVGAIMQLSQEKRGAYIDLKYTGDQAEFTYLIPLAEMIVDFFDRLKSVTEGYASLDYEFFDYQSVDVAKVDILVNKEKVDALSFLVVKDAARHRAIAIVERLADVIPRHQFTVPIQGAIGADIIARADVKSFRKDVIQKLYGGDRTRKDKLLEAQKRGKEKMKSIGKVQIPQSAFFEVLKRE